RAQRVADFSRERMGEQDDTLRNAYAMGLTQAAAFVDALKRLKGQGMVSCWRPQVEQLLAQVTSVGRVNPLLKPEIGCCATTADPAAVIEPHDRIIWWQLADTGSPPRYPWSQREISELSRSGVSLPSTQQRLAQAAEAWLRPVCAARKQLTLVLPPVGV